MEFGLNWTFPGFPEMEQPEAEVEEIIEPLLLESGDGGGVVGM